MSATVPDVTFNNGLTMPQLGYGTWKSKPEEVTEAVKTAIDVGYRNIDCAYCYGNEKEVGAGLKAKMDDGTVKREDLFITSKLWNTFHRRDLVAEAVQLSLDDLGLDYLDLYLIHWPYAYKEGRERFPRDENGKFIYSEGTITDTWKGLEDMVDAGKVRSIGISNFNSLQLQEIMDCARIKPANHQIEVHPYLSQDKMIAFCKERGMTITAHGPIGSRDRPWVKETDPYILEDPKVVEIAKRLDRTPAQVAIRWSIQKGLCPIPKSVTESRIKSNFQVFDFSLSDDDMATLNSFDDEVYRGVKLEGINDHPLYPFNIPF